MTHNPYEAPQAKLPHLESNAASEDAPTFVWLGILALQVAIYAFAILGRRYLFDGGLELILSVLVLIFCVSIIAGCIKKKVAFLILQFIFVLCSLMFSWMLFMPTAMY